MQEGRRTGDGNFYKKDHEFKGCTQLNIDHGISKYKINDFVVLRSKEDPPKQYNKIINLDSN